MPAPEFVAVRLAAAADRSSGGASRQHQCRGGACEKLEWLHSPSQCSGDDWPELRTGCAPRSTGHLPGLTRGRYGVALPKTCPRSPLQNCSLAAESCRSQMKSPPEAAVRGANQDPTECCWWRPHDTTWLR